MTGASDQAANHILLICSVGGTPEPVAAERQRLGLGRLEILQWVCGKAGVQQGRRLFAETDPRLGNVTGVYDVAGVGVDVLPLIVAKGSD